MMLIETNCLKYKSFLVTVTNEELSLKLLSCMTCTKSSKSKLIKKKNLIKKVQLKCIVGTSHLHHLCSSVDKGDGWNPDLIFLCFQQCVGVSQRAQVV